MSSLVYVIMDGSRPVEAHLSLNSAKVKVLDDFKAAVSAYIQWQNTDNKSQIDNDKPPMTQQLFLEVEKMMDYWYPIHSDDCHTGKSYAPGLYTYSDEFYTHLSLTENDRRIQIQTIAKVPVMQDSYNSLYDSV